MSVSYNSQLKSLIDSLGNSRISILYKKNNDLKEILRICDNFMINL
jgi:hypothetical protein